MREAAWAAAPRAVKYLAAETMSPPIAPVKASARIVEPQQENPDAARHA
jgi:hypothetical protein